MSLKTTLQEMKTASRSRIPPQAATVMTNAAEALERSGIVDKALKPGDQAPAFELLDWQGNSYKSSQLLGQGPLILHFYRGSW